MLTRLIAKLKLLDKQRRIRKVAKRAKLDQYKNIEDLFTDYYRQRTWSGGGSETVSGSGSTVKITEALRHELPRLLEKRSIKTIFDAPCGDFNWFRHVERGERRYIGGDIVKELVKANQLSYGDERTSFIHFDIVKGDAPSADLWFCRDVLLHLSYELIFGFLQNFARSGIPYLLVSTYHKFPENIDIPTGAGRPVNLEIAPFHLPPPIDFIEDDLSGRRPKRMGLWTREAIVEALRHRSS